MARRKARRKTRRSRGISILNVIEGYALGNILTQGIAGNSPFGLFLGSSDLSNVPSSYNTQTILSTDLSATGGDRLTLSEFVQDPNYAMTIAAARLQQNIVPMSVAAFTTSAAFKFGRMLLRAPIRKANAQLVRPIFGRSLRI